MNTVRAIEHHRAVWREGNGPGPDLGDEWDSREEVAFESLAASTPASLGEIVALADYIAEQDGGALYGGRSALLARSISQGARALA